MRKIGAVLPTWVFLGTLIMGFCISTTQPIVGHNWVAASTVGLGIYPIIVIFIACMAKTVSGIKTYSRSEKWFYGYLLGVAILTVLGVIYFMAHN